MPVSIRGFATLGLLLFAATAAGQHPLPPELIDFRSEHGEELLVQAEARQAYFRLTSHFVTQENRAFCGVASMTMVLNALQVSAPEVPELAPYRTFTQTNVLDARTEAVVPRETIRNAGLSLDQLAALLATKPVAVSVHHAEDGAIGEFRTRAQDHLSARQSGRKGAATIRRWPRTTGRRTGSWSSTSPATNTPRSGSRPTICSRR